MPILLAPGLLPLGDDSEAFLLGLDYLMAGVFAANLAARAVIAPHQGHYLRTYEFDVALVALPMLQPLHGVRPARFIHVLRASRTGVDTARGLVGFRHALARRGVRHMVASAVILLVVAGSRVTVVERDAPDATICKLPDDL